MLRTLRDRSAREGITEHTDGKIEDKRISRRDECKAEESIKRHIELGIGGKAGLERQRKEQGDTERFRNV